MSTVLISIVGFAQTDIATARAQGIGASVTITELNTDNILNYSITNGKGYFSIFKFR